jgi:hypothetical protein
MENQLEKELQALQSDYNRFKEALEMQTMRSERLLKSLRRGPVLAVNREFRHRMWMDALTVPAVFVICIYTHWPVIFGILVSLWALTDLGISWWVARKLGMSRLLDGDARAVAEKIAGYRKFYFRSLMISLLPLTVMLAYIFVHLCERAAHPAAVQQIAFAGIVFVALAVAIAVDRYRKHVERCNDVLRQFEE